MSEYTNRVKTLTSRLLGEAEEMTPYQKFFQSALKKFGVSSPDQLDADKASEFFDYVDANWDAGENETDVDEGIQTADDDLDGDLDPESPAFDDEEESYDDAVGEADVKAVDPSLARIKKVDEGPQKIDMKQVYMILKNPKDKSQQMWIVNRAGKGASPQDKVNMYIVDPKGNVIDDMGTHANLKGALKFGKARGFENKGMVGQGMANEAGVDPDTVTSIKGSFSPQMIKKLQKAYSQIQRMDPSSEEYKRLIKWMGKLDVKQLQAIEQGNIKWLSSLARNRLPTNKIKQVEGRNPRRLSEAVSPKDKKVIDAFTDKKPMEGNKLTTDGKRLDGTWSGGRGIAEWGKDGKIHFNDLGSKAAQSVQNALKKMTPANWLAENDEEEMLRQEIRSILRDMM